MAKQKRYIFNHLTQNFEVLETSKSRAFFRVLLITLAVLGVAFLFAVLLFTFLKSPKEKAQARELEYMKLQYEILNDRLDNMEALMTDMEQRDNNIYRLVFEADPIPSSVRRSGFTDADRYADMYGYMNSGLVVNAAHKLDVISSQLYHQSVSYDSLFVMVRNKSDMLAHIPAIFPLKESEIKYISSYFGYRPDPIYKIEKFHSGIDFSSTLNTEAYATGDGVVFDVAVDLRPGSPTYGKYHGVLLTGQNNKLFLIPRGFAHGFLVLSNFAEFHYKCDDFYHPNDEGGIAWNDPDIGIEWPELCGSYPGSADPAGYDLSDGTQLLLSEKDKHWERLKDIPEFADPACPGDR